MEVKAWKIAAVGIALAFLVAAEVSAQNDLSKTGLPEGAVNRLGTRQWRHGSRILALAYSPSGRILAAGGGADPVRLWDSDSGVEWPQAREYHPEWKARTIWVTAMAWLPHSNVLATAGMSKTIYLWAPTGRKVGELSGHATAVKALASSPNSKLLASGGQDGSLVVWDYDTRAAVAKVAGHTDEVLALAFSPSSNLLASAGGDRTIRLWDANTGKPVRQFDGLCAVSALVFVDEKTLAAAGDDHLIRLWDVQTGKPLATLTGHEGPVVSLHLVPGGRTLLSGGHDQSMRLWDVTKRTESAKIGRNGGDGDALVLSPDGKHLAAAGQNHTIRRWEVASGKELPTGPGHQGPVCALALAADGKLLASATPAGELRLWDPGTGKEIKQWSNGTPLGADDGKLAFAPDSKTLAAAAGAEAVHLWDAASGQLDKKLEGSGNDPVLSLTFAPNSGQYLAVGHRHQGIRIWDVAQTRIHQHLKFAGKVHALAYAPDGKTLAAAGAFLDPGNDKDGKPPALPAPTIVLYNPATGAEIRRLAPVEGSPLFEITALAFGPDGKTLAAAGDNAVVRLWNTEKGKEIRTLEGHDSAVYGLAFSPDGRMLATGSFDKTVRLWETFSGLAIAVWKGHRGPVTAVAVSANGRVVFSGSADTSLLAWDVTGRSPGGNMPAWHPPLAELEADWRNLAAEDVSRGQRAVWDLVAATSQSVAFLDKHIFLLDPKILIQRIAELDHDTYQIRIRATQELAKYGRWIEGPLTAELKKKVTVEMDRRIRGLLEKLTVPGALSLPQELLRYRRAMMVLEQVGGAAARQVLEKMTAGAPDAALRDEAHAALERLAKRNGP